MADLDFSIFIALALDQSSFHRKATERRGLRNRDPFQPLILSRENNRSELAKNAFADALGGVADDIFVATQDQGLEWVTIT